MINIGDLIFNTPSQGKVLPQGKEGEIYVANYYYTAAVGAAVTVFTSNILQVNNANSFLLLGFECTVRVLTAANALVQPEYAQVSMYGGNLDFPIPYPVGMEPVTNGFPSAPVLTDGGNPYAKKLKVDLGNGYFIQPNTQININVDLYKSVAFAATDNLTTYVRMFWSL